MNIRVIGIVLILVLANIMYGFYSTGESLERDDFSILKYSCSNNPLTKLGYNIYLLAIEQPERINDKFMAKACEMIDVDSIEG